MDMNSQYIDDRDEGSSVNLHASSSSLATTTTTSPSRPSSPFRNYVGNNTRNFPVLAPTQHSTSRSSSRNAPSIVVENDDEYSPHGESRRLSTSTSSTVSPPVEKSSTTTTTTRARSTSPRRRNENADIGSSARFTVLSSSSSSSATPKATPPQQQYLSHTFSSSSIHSRLSSISPHFSTSAAAPAYHTAAAAAAAAADNMLAAPPAYATTLESALAQLTTSRSLLFRVTEEKERLEAKVATLTKALLELQTQHSACESQIKQAEIRNTHVASLEAMVTQLTDMSDEAFARVAEAEAGKLAAMKKTERAELRVSSIETKIESLARTTQRGQLDLMAAQEELEKEKKKLTTLLARLYTSETLSSSANQRVQEAEEKAIRLEQRLQLMEIKWSSAEAKAVSAEIRAQQAFISKTNAEKLMIQAHVRASQFEKRAVHAEESIHAAHEAAAGAQSAAAEAVALLSERELQLAGLREALVLADESLGGSGDYMGGGDVVDDDGSASTGSGGGYSSSGRMSPMLPILLMLPNNTTSTMSAANGLSNSSSATIPPPAPPLLRRAGSASAILMNSNNNSNNNNNGDGSSGSTFSPSDPASPYAGAGAGATSGLSRELVHKNPGAAVVAVINTATQRAKAAEQSLSDASKVFESELSALRQRLLAFESQAAAAAKETLPMATTFGSSSSSGKPNVTLHTASSSSSSKPPVVVVGAVTTTTQQTDAELEAHAVVLSNDGPQNIEELVQLLRTGGLMSSQLVIFIDCTKSNLTNGAKSFGGKSLHDVSGSVHAFVGTGSGGSSSDSSDTGAGAASSTSPILLNPYQMVISCIGKSLQPFDADQQYPVFGFGDKYSADVTVFPFHSNPTTFCVGVDEILAAYTKKIQKVILAGPTSFAPSIKKTIDLLKKAPRREFTICLIIADGQVNNIRETETAIIEASRYPISIIVIGVGDDAASWKDLRRFDQIQGKKLFDNFRFVSFNSIIEAAEEKGMDFDTAFAISALLEVPAQFKRCKELRLI